MSPTAGQGQGIKVIRSPALIHLNAPAPVFISIDHLYAKPFQEKYVTGKEPSYQN